MCPPTAEWIETRTLAGGVKEIFLVHGMFVNGQWQFVDRLLGWELHWFHLPATEARIKIANQLSGGSDMPNKNSGEIINTIVVIAIILTIAFASIASLINAPWFFY